MVSEKQTSDCLRKAGALSPVERKTHLFQLVVTCYYRYAKDRRKNSRLDEHARHCLQARYVS